MYGYFFQSIDKYAIRKYEKSIIILSIIFTILDVFAILFSLYYIRVYNKVVIDLKSKITKIFLIDIIFRLLYAKNYRSSNILNEIISTSLNVSQFYLIILFISIALPTQYKLNEKKHQFILCIKFAFIIFAYEKIPFQKIFLNWGINFISFNQRQINIIITIIRTFSLIILIFSYFKSYSDKMLKIGNYLINEANRKDNKIYHIIIGSPMPCVIFFILYLVLNLAFFLMEKNLLYILCGVFRYVFKECSKLFVLFLCELILFSLYKINRNKELNTQIFGDEKNIININQN